MYNIFYWKYYILFNFLEKNYLSFFDRFFFFPNIYLCVIKNMDHRILFIYF